MLRWRYHLAQEDENMLTKQAIALTPSLAPNRRRTGGDRYRDQVITMLKGKGYNVSDSTYQQDMREASDLIVDGNGCAMRMRSEKALQRWPNDFTFRALRSDRCAADNVEFVKIMSGCAKYAIFGFVDGDDRIALMRMLDLDVFRKSITSDVERYDRPTMVGADGVEYLTFSIKEFPPEMIIHTWDQRH